MAKNEDESSQMSIDIQNSLLKILDFNEDEEEENTSSSNKRSNKASEDKKMNSKVRDNVSDYTGYRTPISNIDNKSMNSNQDSSITRTKRLTRLMPNTISFHWRKLPPTPRWTLWSLPPRENQG